MSYLDSLDGILYLEEASLGGEGLQADGVGVDARRAAGQRSARANRVARPS